MSNKRAVEVFVTLLLIGTLALGAAGVAWRHHRVTSLTRQLPQWLTLELTLPAEKRNVPIKSLIRQGADANVASADGHTPLMWAAIGRDYPWVNELLDRGASPNAATKDGDTALIFAVSVADLPTVNELLARGADVNAKNANGHTALMVAAGAEGRILREDLDIIRTLLKHGARVDERDNEGNTALHHSQGRAMALLVEAGASVHIVNHQGETALVWAALNKSPADIRLLLRHGAGPYLASPRGREALLLVRQRGPTEVVRLLEAALKKETQRLKK